MTIRVLVQAAVCGCLVACSSASLGEIIFTETFDDDTNFKPNQDLVFSAADPADYFGLTYGNTPGVDEKAYGGFDGRYLAGRDVDGIAGFESPAVNLTWMIDVSGFENLQFSGKFAQSQDSIGQIDADDYLTLTASLDGGVASEILAFRGVGGVFTSSLNQQLWDTASVHSGAIAGSGNVLTLVFSASVNNGSEDFGADTFIVTGTPMSEPVPEPGFAGLLAGLALLVRRRRA